MNKLQDFINNLAFFYVSWQKVLTFSSERFIWFFKITLNAIQIFRNCNFICI